MKVGVSEALKEHGDKVRKLENEIDKKNYRIRELENEKAISEQRLRNINSNVAERDKTQSEITRLKKEIEKLKKRWYS